MLVGSLVPQNDLGELAKLPELVRHFRFHHSAAGGGLSLGAFLAEHYGAGEPQHTGYTVSDWHKQAHHDLPLRCHHGCTWAGFVLAATVVLPPVPYAAVRPVGYALARAPRPADGLVQALVQPPRA